MAIFFARGQTSVPDWYRTPKQIKEDLENNFWPNLPPAKRKAEKDRWMKIWKQYETPIEFYGKILDEDGNPVARAKVKFQVVDGTEEGLSDYSAVSNLSGEFRIKGIIGKTLDVKIYHPKYYLSKNNPLSFEFGDASDPLFIVSNSRSPIVFHAKKRGVSEPLINTRGQWTFVEEMKPIYINLISVLEIKDPKLYGQADLVATLGRRPEVDGVSPWLLSLEVLGEPGGLIGSTEEFMFKAPPEGYQKKIELDFSDFKKSKTGPELYFYLCSREGRNYARLKIRMVSTTADEIDPKTGKNKRLCVLSIRYLLNPGSSRNLEYEEGNSIMLQFGRGGSLKLIYPIAEDLEEARKDLLENGNPDEPDSIQRSYDFFPD